MADVKTKSKQSLVVRGVASVVILMGTAGLIATLALAVVLYQVGSYLGQTWGVANEGIKGSSQILMDTRDAVDSASSTVKALEEGASNVEAATERLGQGLVEAERSTNSFSSSLSAVGSSLESVGRVIPPVGQLGQTGSLLVTAGTEAEDASEGLASLEIMWQGLREDTFAIGRAMDDVQMELPTVRRDLSNVSQGLESASATLASIADDLETLRKADTIFWIFGFILTYFSTLSLGLVLIGIVLLKI